MSDDKGQQEPSMEDILASIRRILSEDEAEEAPNPAKTAPPSASSAPSSPPAPPPTQDEAEDDDVLELTDDMVAEDASGDVGEPEIDFAAWGVEEELEPEPEPAPAPVRSAAQPPPPAYEPPPMAELEEDDGGEPSWVSSPVAEASTAALSELARAVARERMVGLGARGLTLEDLVRDIMKPILKDWLDKNLPYMIERIVRKEIERMINRAEKF